LMALLLVVLVVVGGVALGLWLEATRGKNAQTTRRDIEGYWTGILQDGTDHVRLIVKFTKQADGPHTGTFQADTVPGKEWQIDNIQFNDSSLRFEIKVIPTIYEGQLKEDGQELVGEWKKPVGHLALTFQRQAAEPTFARRQEPKRPYPYREEEITYENPKARAKLAGTLTLPQGQGPFPAVLLLLP